MSRRRTPSHAIDAVREVLTGATLRGIMRIRETGETFLATVAGLDGADHANTDGDQDVWLGVQDVITGYPQTHRLFIPGNILFSLPEEGETCMVLEPREGGGPGAGYVLHGDGGVSLPDWLRTKVGLFTRKVLRLQSSSDDVEVECGGGKNIKLGPAASRGVARLNDTTADGTIVFAFSPGTGGATLSITYTDPNGGMHPLPTGSGTITLSGLINSASSKTQSE